MHDAIQAYDQRYEPYAGAIAAGEGSAIAAAARAAHTVLLTKFPGQLAAIDACYATSMAGVAITSADLIASNAVGNMAAWNVLASRDGDGSFPAGPITPFTGGSAPGQWRVNAGTASMVAPWLGDVRPFAIGSVQRCQPDDLPALTSLDYAEAYNEVKEVGSINSTKRTPDQGHMARTFSVTDERQNPEVISGRDTLDRVKQVSPIRRPVLRVLVFGGFEQHCFGRCVASLSRSHRGPRMKLAAAFRPTADGSPTNPPKAAGARSTWRRFQS